MFMPLRAIAVLLFLFSAPCAYAAVEAPTTVVVFGCKVVPGHTGMIGSKDWIDLDWDISKFYVDCHRYVVPLQDAAAALGDKDLAHVPSALDGRKIDDRHGNTGPTSDEAGVTDLHPNFADLTTCARVSLDYASKWAKDNPGRWPFVSCPTPIVNIPKGCNSQSCEETIGFSMPDCPREIGGLRVVCEVDSEI